ncbi:hypothetical protein RI054_14g69270 [Pseudoscourfieldia marina]
MDDHMGGLVYNSWKTLWIHDVITPTEVVAAVRSGRLPAYFEQKVRELPEDQRSDYTAELVEGNSFPNILWNRTMLDHFATT